MTEKMKIEVDGYEVLEKRATASGDTARIYAPAGWAGKRVKLILLEPLE